MISFRSDVYRVAGHLWFSFVVHCGAFSHAGMAGKESKSAAKKSTSAKATRQPRKDPLWKALLPIVVVLVSGLGPMLYKYGWRILLPSDLKTLDIDADTWMDEVLPNRTFVFVAGHHRGGTTLMWEILREHPDVGAFGQVHETGVDKSEGAFLQSVLPTFGVGSETTWMHRVGASKKILRGVGTYALHKFGNVTWNEVNLRERVTPSNLVKLLNEWGYFWKANGGWDKYYWMEKTPTNAVLSRFIQALFDQGLETEQRTNKLNVPWDLPRDSRTKFVFMMRHPLGNAMAHQQWNSAKHLSLQTLLENWISVSRIMTEDCDHLKHCLFVRLEDLAKDPAQEIARVVSFLGLPDFKWGTKVYPDPNEKYAQSYCSAMAEANKGGVEAFLQHINLIKEYGEEVKKFGYDLNEWPCLQDSQKSFVEKWKDLAEQRKQKEEL